MAYTVTTFNILLLCFTYSITEHCSVVTVFYFTAFSGWPGGPS